MSWVFSFMSIMSESLFYYEKAHVISVFTGTLSLETQWTLPAAWSLTPSLVVSNAQRLFIPLDDHESGSVTVINLSLLPFVFSFIICVKDRFKTAAFKKSGFIFGSVRRCACVCARVCTVTTHTLVWWNFEDAVGCSANSSASPYSLPSGTVKYKS